MKKVTRNTDDKSLICLTFFLLLSPQIQNADDVLITPLEKFRKEQIGAAKVGDHLHEQLAIEKRRFLGGEYVCVCECVFVHSACLLLTSTAADKSSKDNCAHRGVLIRARSINGDVNAKVCM